MIGIIRRKFVGNGLAVRLDQSQVLSFAAEREVRVQGEVRVAAILVRSKYDQVVARLDIDCGELPLDQIARLIGQVPAF